MAFIVKCAPVLKEWNFCCCSCSLRAASVVLAWIITIMHISDFVSCVIYLSHTAIQSETPYENTKVLVSVLGMLVGALIIDALLLYGIHNKKPIYMLPYLVVHLISLMVVMTLVFIGGVFVTVNSWDWHLIIPLIITAVFVLLTAFFWVVLYSYYRQIEEEKNSNSGIVNCTYNIPNEQVQMLGVDDKVPSYSPNKLAPDMA